MISKGWVKSLLIISVFGLVVSTIIHLLSWLPISIEFPPAINLLGLLIFPLFLSVIIMSRQAQKQMRRAGKYDPFNIWKALAPKAPQWTILLVVVLLVYVFGNFFLTQSLLKGGVVGVIEGQRVLYSHGTIIEVLTDEAYYRYSAYIVRLSSGHWLYFYTIVSLALYSKYIELQGQSKPVSSAYGKSSMR